MDPNQEGQPQQGGSVPPTSPAPGMPPAQAGGSPAPTSGMPPAQTAGTPPAGSPVFGTQGTTTAADPAPTPVSTPAPAPGVLSASGTPATPPLTPRRSFRPASAGAAQAGASSQFAQPDPSQPSSQIIASGNLPAAGNGKKPSRNLIIAIVVVAVLAIIVGIVASTSSNNNSNSGNSSSSTTPVNMTELATAYNNLANYIAFGDENVGEKEFEDGKTYSTHELLESSTASLSFDPILKADIMLETDSSTDRTIYFQNFDQLYQRLPNLMNNYGINIENIYDYYHNFSTIGYISKASIISRYKTNGFEPTRSYIENTVVSNSDESSVAEYAGYMREYDLSFLDLINDIKVNQGCELEPNNSSNCNYRSAASYSAYEDSLANISRGSAFQIKYNYQKAAIQSLLSIYDLINDSNGGSK